MRKTSVKLLVLVVLVLVLFILTYEEEPAAPPPVQDNAGEASPAPRTGTESLRLLTWNVLNFGQSKEDDEVAFIADRVRDYDVVALQEVNTRPDGAQAVARLDAELDRRGAQWDYVISDPTDGPGSERYAYLWKPSRARLVGRAWLADILADAVDREPFLARFAVHGSNAQVLLASFHAVPTAKRPADEVAVLDELHRRYADDHLLILGDFNLAESHYAFDELKEAGYRPALVDQKTSIRMRRKDGEHLANEYDNIFYEAAPLRVGASGVIDFTSDFRTLTEARRISDHLPVYIEVRWN